MQSYPRIYYTQHYVKKEKLIYWSFVFLPSLLQLVVTDKSREIRNGFVHDQD